MSTPTGAATRARHTGVLDAIRRSMAGRGYPPTMREIAEEMGWESTATVHYALRQLEDLGRIRRAPGTARAIEIVDDPDGAREVLGVPIPADTGHRAQVGLVQRLAEQLLAAGRELRDADLPVAAHELEHAAQGLIAGADRQLDVVRAAGLRT